MKFYPLWCAMCLSMCLASQYALAQSTPTKKATATKLAISKEAATDEDDIIPDIKDGTADEYKCELNDTLTIYTNGDDNQHIALRWKNKLYRLRRIETTTGAHRFENKKAGLVWIGIPTKGMLLDSRHGQQLANECKTRGQ